MREPRGNTEGGTRGGPGRARYTVLHSAADFAVLAASADGIVAVDDRGVIRLCNPAAEYLFGRPSGELVGTEFGFPIAAGTAEIDLLLPGGGRRVVEMRTTTVSVQRERLHVAVLRDITGHRELEFSLRTALERQNMIIGVTAHELGNPLAEIGFLLDGLRDPETKVFGDQAPGTLIDRIAERAAYMQQLIHKLLTASRMEAPVGRPLQQEVRALEVVLESLTAFPQRAHEVQLACPPDLVALVDRREFAEMLINYLENAFVYGSPPIEVGAREVGDRVEVSVCDHGPGVPERFVPYLFERFAREPSVEQETEGTGLGLWIVRNLAQANGGDAWYERNPDGGSCFYLRLRRP